MALKYWTLDRNLGLNQNGNPSTMGDDGYVLKSHNTSWMTKGVLSLRRGALAQSLTSSGFTSANTEIKWLGRHLTNAGAEELWGAANAAGAGALARRSAGTWAAVTYSDTVTVANLLYHHSATLNGKFFLAYDSNVNRLHVWDGTALRRVGILKPDPPTVADALAGAYAATLRRYRIAYRIKSGTDIQAQSELSTAVSFTPSGVQGAARVTKSATVDSATHWVVYGLIGTAGDTYDLYMELVELAVGTTAWDDQTNPSAYSGDSPPALGLNIPPPSVKFLLSDGARLIGTGVWETSGASGETAPKANRVYFSRPLGASDLGDDESIPSTYFLDVGDAGPTTGLLGPIYGDVYVFKQRSIWKMVPTQDAEQPYRAVMLTDTAGALDQRLIAPIGKVGAAFADESVVYLLSAESEPVPLSLPISLSIIYGGAVSAAGWMAYDQWARTLYLIPSNGPNATVPGFSYAMDTACWGTVAFDTTVMNRGVMAQTNASTFRFIMAGKVSVANATALMLATEAAAVPQDNGVVLTGTVRARRVAAPGCRLSLQGPTVWYRAMDATGTLALTITYTRMDDNASQSSGAVTLPILTDLTFNGGVGMVTVDGLALADAQVADVTFDLSQTSGSGSGVLAPPAIDRVVMPYEEAPQVVTR